MLTPRPPGMLPATEPRPLAAGTAFYPASGAGRSRGRRGPSPEPDSLCRGPFPAGPEFFRPTLRAVTGSPEWPPHFCCQRKQFLSEQSAGIQRTQEIVGNLHSRAACSTLLVSSALGRRRGP